MQLLLKLVPFGTDPSSPDPSSLWATSGNHEQCEKLLIDFDYVTPQKAQGLSVTCDCFLLKQCIRGVLSVPWLKRQAVQWGISR